MSDLSYDLTRFVLISDVGHLVVAHFPTGDVEPTCHVVDVDVGVSDLYSLCQAAASHKCEADR